VRQVAPHDELQIIYDDDDDDDGDLYVAQREMEVPFAMKCSVPIECLVNYHVLREYTPFICASS
jgi:hypothetical protein